MAVKKIREIIEVEKAISMVLPSLIHLIMIMT